MRDLIILGTGVHAGEMVEIVARINAAQPAWNLLGLIAAGDGSAETRRELNGCPILGIWADIGRYSDAALVPCNEWPRALRVPRERLVSIVDPSCFVSRTAGIGAGCVIYPGGFIGLNAVLADCVFALAGCVINHDVRLDEHAVLCSGVLLAGGVRVERDCYLGQGCTVRQNLRIGRGSLVGMGSVVVDNVPPGIVVAGNPARKLRDAE
jgi:sugar O-acyltransferase (sialic acid O-acetyltransferase NeuD family)